MSMIQVWEDPSADQSDRSEAKTSLDSTLDYGIPSGFFQAADQHSQIILEISLPSPVRLKNRTIVYKGVGNILIKIRTRETMNQRKTGLLASIKRGKNYIAWGFITVWASVLIFIVATLMVGHWVTLPVPSGDDLVLARAIDESRDTRDLGQWYTVHFLYSKCTCSNDIADHLFNSERPAGLREKLVFIDHHAEWEAAAAAKGFEYEVITQLELKQTYNIDSAPVMVVAGPDSKVYYAGAYTERKQAYEIKDLEIIANIQANNPVETLPLFGCAVAKGLQEILDPLGLKYSS